MLKLVDVFFFNLTPKFFGHWSPLREDTVSLVLAAVFIIISRHANFACGNYLSEKNIYKTIYNNSLPKF